LYRDGVGGEGKRIVMWGAVGEVSWKRRFECKKTHACSISRGVDQTTDNFLRLETTKAENLLVDRKSRPNKRQKERVLGEESFCVARAKNTLTVHASRTSGRVMAGKNKGTCYRGGTTQHSEVNAG